MADAAEVVVKHGLVLVALPFVMSLPAATHAGTPAPSDPPLAFLVFYGGGIHGVPERGSIFVADLSGRGIKRLTAPDAFATDPAWSPGTGRIAYTQDDKIFVMDRNGRHRRLIANAYASPRWSPDGERLLFAKRYDTLEIVDVATRKARTLHVRFVGQGLDWSPDGRRIVAASGDGISAIRVEDGSVRTLVSAPPGVALDMPRWSPDGKRLVYTWHKDRSTFLYLANADGSNARRLIRTDAGARANWSWDGHRLVYGVRDIRLLNLRTGARRKIDLRLCRRYSCQDLDWSRTR